LGNVVVTASAVVYLQYKYICTIFNFVIVLLMFMLFYLIVEYSRSVLVYSFLRGAVLLRWLCVCNVFVRSFILNWVVVWWEVVVGLSYVVL
jgi:hypothetical protein